MEWVETTGKTVEEAKDAALDQLGVDENDAEFVVMSEPKAGLFGRMRGEARVRARVMPTAPRPKRGGRSRRTDQQRRSTRQGGGQRSGGGSSRAGTAVADREDADEAEDSESSNGARSGQGSNAQAGGGSATGTGTRKRRRRGGRGRGRGGSGGPKPEGGAGANGNGNGSSGSGSGEARQSRQGSNSGRPRAAEVKEEPVGETLSLEEQGEAARQFVAGLVQEIGLSADVSVKVIDEDTAEVAVTGSDLGLLVGPGGATLAALQELARTVVQKHTGGHSDRILIDVAGYRAKRADALQRFTRQVAEEVLSSGEEKALEPMTAADRKVVHDTVNEIDGVATRSEGEDPRRYIVISATADAAEGDDA